MTSTPNTQRPTPDAQAENRELERRSSAVTLSDMEIFDEADTTWVAGLAPALSARGLWFVDANLPADALSAAEGLRLLGVWKHRAGLLRDNGVVRSRRGLSSAGNLFTWRPALETPSLHLATFATPTRLSASELLGYARDAAARALLLKYEPEPSMDSLPASMNLIGFSVRSQARIS